jgi:hypothetical protein
MALQEHCFDDRPLILECVKTFTIHEGKLSSSQCKLIVQLFHGICVQDKSVLMTA